MDSLRRIISVEFLEDDRVEVTVDGVTLQEIKLAVIMLAKQIEKIGKGEMDEAIVDRRG